VFLSGFCVEIWTLKAGLLMSLSCESPWWVTKSADEFEWAVHRFIWHNNRHIIKNWLIQVFPFVSNDAYCATTCCKMRGLYTWALIMKVNGKQFRKQLSDSAHQGPEWVVIFPGPDELAALEESCLQEASEVRGNRQLVLDVGWWVIYMHRSVP